MEITIEQLANAMNVKLWQKGDLKRIYLNEAGHNTKKMSTKTFIWQDENGEFKISCRVECPSQPYQWCKSQEDQVKESVFGDIKDAIWNIEHPGALDHYPYAKRVKYLFDGTYEKKESQVQEKEQKFLTISQPANTTRTSTTSINYEIGKKYHHLKFGIGMVTAEDAEIVTIEFPEVGVKQLLKRFVKLTVIE